MSEQQRYEKANDLLQKFKADIKTLEPKAKRVWMFINFDTDTEFLEVSSIPSVSKKDLLTEGAEVPHG